MRNATRASLVLSLLISTALASPRSAQAQDVQPVERVDTPHGPIQVSTVGYPNRTVRAGRAGGVVDAPLDAVQRVIEDYGNYKAFMPHFRSSRVLNRRGPSAIIYLEAAIASGTLLFWVQLKVKPERANHDALVLVGKKLKGNMKAMDTRWELRPVSARHTCVVFELLLEPRLPLPSSLVSRENAIAARKSIVALRKYVTGRSVKAQGTSEQAATGGKSRSTRASATRVAGSAACPHATK